MLRCGLDINSETPEEIAVSIVAELIKVRGQDLKTEQHSLPTKLASFTFTLKDPDRQFSMYSLRTGLIFYGKSTINFIAGRQ